VWLAKTAYPDFFKDIDMIQEVKKFYSEIMSFNLSNEQALAILSAKYAVAFGPGPKK
jgi:hypothetical protein